MQRSLELQRFTIAAVAHNILLPLVDKQSPEGSKIVDEVFQWGFYFFKKLLFFDEIINTNNFKNGTSKVRRSDLPGPRLYEGAVFFCMLLGET